MFPPRGDKLRNIFILCVAGIAMSACYIHYPSIGVVGNRIKPTSWYGETLQRCCYITLNIDTGSKEYYCENIYPSQCAKFLGKDK